MTPDTAFKHAVTPADDYELWLWIELIGFDADAKNFGVAQLLENMQTVPRAISILLTTPEFVHCHEGLAEERVLPPEQCSYAGRLRGRHRNRQQWTNHQFRGLVGELQRNGIAVYCSFLDIVSFHVDGRAYSGEWAQKHPEVWEMRRNGERLGVVNPLRRLADKSPYRDFFIPQLLRVLCDYNFDGYHGADGYTSPRRPLHDTDYSDDMVEQFLTATGITLPPGISASCEGDESAMEQRAEWLWEIHRREWILFHAECWTDFWRAVTDGVHGANRQVVLNNAWTRDPLQALYRYGVDYEKLASVGIDGFIPETVGAGVSIGAESGIVANPYYDFQAMLLLMKASAPRVPLRPLNPTLDVTENWDVLHHAPTVAERDIYSLAGLFIHSDDGLQPCSAGPTACLASDLEAADWTWLKARWDAAYDGQVERGCGATLVWETGRLAAHLDDYLETRRFSVHKLTYELMARGAPIRSVIAPENLADAAGPLLVLHPHLLSAKALQALKAYDRGPIIIVGSGESPFSAPGLSFTDAVEHLPLQCHCRGFTCDKEAVDTPPAPTDTTDLVAGTCLGDAEPQLYMHEPVFTPVSSIFLQRVAHTIRDCSNAPKVVQGNEHVTAWAFAMSNGFTRLFVANESFYYVMAVVELGRRVQDIRPVSAFPTNFPAPVETALHIKVPGRGIVVADIAWDGCT